MRRLRRWLLWFVLLLAVLVVLVAVTPQGRTGVKAVLFIPQVVPAFPFQPQELFTRGPTRTDVHFPIPGGQGTADLYVPARGDQHGAVLLFLGVNPAGRDDERVVGLAEGLARAGMVVMIPWSEHMTQKRMRPEDIEDLVFAFQFLQLHPAVDAETGGDGGLLCGRLLLRGGRHRPPYQRPGEVHQLLRRLLRRCGPRCRHREPDQYLPGD